MEDEPVIQDEHMIQQEPVIQDEHVIQQEPVLQEEPVIEEEHVMEQKRAMPSIECIQNQNLQLKRYERNELLLKTDKYLLNDFPLTDDKKNQVIAYRQSLRDYFDRHDVINWTFTFENQQPPDFVSAPDFIQF
jgi:hypothetical protein